MRSAGIVPLLAALGLALAVGPCAYAQTGSDQAGSTQAESSSAGPAPVPEPPPLPPKVQSGEPLEPDVTITEGEKQTVTEYRVGGRLVAVKIQPKGAPAYYLVDADGDGRLETRTNALSPNFLIPGWIILQW